MTLYPYDRQAAVDYAHRWAYHRNPDFYSFDELGGDCTNFASQCLYAGAGVMDYTPTFGWYYNSQYSRAPAWTGVPFFYNFLTRKKETPGPVGEEAEPALRPQPGHCVGGQSARPGQHPGCRPQRGRRLPASVHLPYSGGPVPPYCGGAPLT